MTFEASHSVKEFSAKSYARLLIVILPCTSYAEKKQFHKVDLLLAKFVLFVILMKFSAFFYMIDLDQKNQFMLKSFSKSFFS